MSPLAIISVLGLMVSISLATIALVRNARDEANRVFAFTCILVVYASITEAGYRTAVTVDAAGVWLRAQAFWPLVLAALLHFSLVYTGLSRWSRKWYALTLIYVPALLYSLYDLTGGVFTVAPVKEAWGWRHVVEPGFLTSIGYVWVLGMTILPPIITWRHYARSRGRGRQQARCVALGFTVATGVALSTSYLFLLFNIDSPSLTGVSFVVGGVFILYATWRYDLFALTAASAAEEILATMSDLMFIVSPEGRITTVNQAASWAIAYGDNDTIGRQIGEVLLPPRASAAGASTPTPVWPPPGGAIRDLEMEVKGQGGRTIPVSVSASEVRGNDRTTMGFVYIARDITERKQAQVGQRELYERERALRQDLESEIRKRTDFARILTHELKTPLTAIVASTELLGDDLGPELWKRISDNIRRSALALDKRITELLQMSQGEAGMLELRVMTVAPKGMLEEIAESMAPVVTNRGQSLVLELPDTLPDIRADIDRIQQVILNLIDNALKYSTAGGTISLRAVPQGRWLTISVRDTGRGISQADQAHLFNPYTRLDSREKKVGGMGLGLAICKIIVELHGGRIWVESEEGKGSTFSFRVPLAPHGETAPTAGVRTA